MKAPKCVQTEEPSDESPRPSLPQLVCLADVAEPWLRDHFYRRAEMSSTRLLIISLCACTGHLACKKLLWQMGLPPGADRHSWDGKTE